MRVTDVNQHNFGLLIAYVLPGFLAVLQVAQFTPTVQDWLAVGSTEAPTVGGFLYVTVASVFAGLLAGAVRWLVIDPIHCVMGVRRPQWNFTQLQSNVDAFERMVQYHFRYYEFYANSLLVLLFVAVAPSPFFGWFTDEPVATVLIASATAIVLFCASRDALQKYYARVSILLSAPHPRKGTRHD